MHYLSSASNLGRIRQNISLCSTLVVGVCRLFGDGVVGQVVLTYIRIWVVTKGSEESGSRLLRQHIGFMDEIRQCGYILLPFPLQMQFSHFLFNLVWPPLFLFFTFVLYRSPLSEPFIFDLPVQLRGWFFLQDLSLFGPWTYVPSNVSWTRFVLITFRVSSDLTWFPPFSSAGQQMFGTFCSYCIPNIMEDTLCLWSTG
ncbi:hypothetical protein NPIL_114721 [Nephila pilipes]|uniref:Uncharacterized protein n=1 Tax=Nephila pilipes TaxID=299642 RepID=A0A8X6PHY1_NEPPI|nr:hypothetical protein NPIL_114721 [Nephila pilipes]